jgi:mRNA interferase RelE/StbE
VASYSLFLKPSAVKELEALPLAQRRRVVTRIRGLGVEPRPHGSEKLSAEEKYRVRLGTYRVLYTIDDKKHEVVVVKIAHRREAYR